MVVLTNTPQGLFNKMVHKLRETKGGEGSKMPKSCTRDLWMTPKKRVFVAKKTLFLLCTIHTSIQSVENAIGSDRLQTNIEFD